MSGTKISGSKTSALEYMLLEAVNAFPSDAHLHLYALFERSGESPEELDRFRRTWNRAFVNSRLFGQDTGIDVSKLSDQLAEEIGLKSNEYLLSKLLSLEKYDRSDEIRAASSNFNSFSASATASLRDLQTSLEILQVLDRSITEISMLPAGAERVNKAPERMLELRKAVRVRRFVEYYVLIMIIFYSVRE